MCGRYTLRTPAGLLVSRFQLPLFADLDPRFNIAPTQQVAAVRRASGGGERELAWLQWGLVPSWAKDPAIGSRMINARGETVAEKPSFRSAFKSRRCLILADGYYEWQKTGGQKQPYFIHFPDERPFAMAGLFEQWRGGPDPLDKLGGAPPLETCTIITTGANDLTRPIHDRMPVILDPADYDIWLDPANSDRRRLEPLLRPLDSDELVATPVSQYVNNPRHEGTECVRGEVL